MGDKISARVKDEPGLYPRAFRDRGEDDRFREVFRATTVDPTALVTRREKPMIGCDGSLGKTNNEDIEFIIRGSDGDCKFAR